MVVMSYLPCFFIIETFSINLGAKGLKDLDSISEKITSSC